jgi:hypothetical protein
MAHALVHTVGRASKPANKVGLNREVMVMSFGLGQVLRGWHQAEGQCGGPV